MIHLVQKNRAGKKRQIERHEHEKQYKQQMSRYPVFPVDQKIDHKTIIGPFRLWHNTNLIYI